MVLVVRLAPVIWSHGVVSVSGVDTRTRDTGTVASSAAIWASTVSAPWPISTLPVSTLSDPSPLSFTTLEGGKGAAALDDRADAAGADAGAVPHRPVTLRPADPLGRDGQQVGVVVLLGDLLAGREVVPRNQHVFQPQLKRVHADGVRDPVHLLLVRPRHLWNSEASERA